MSLDFHAVKALGSFRLDAAFAAPPGVTSLFGPSGAGKTTIVDCIAGLKRPDAGAISLDGTTLFDGAAKVFLAARKRRIGYVPQDGRLFPHLSVRHNLLYGRWFAGKSNRWSHFDEIVSLLGIDHLVDRRPGGLSGGEARRVAIGRALLASPKLLLLDEPLSGLDANRREEILPYLERLRDQMKLPIVHVSHDIDEVARLADTLVLVSGGKVVEVGPLASLLGRLDLMAYTGRFEASSMLTARIEAHDEAAGITVLAHPAGRLFVPRLQGMEGDAVRVRLRARDVSVAIGEVGRLSIRNRLKARIVEIAAREKPIVDVRMDAGGEFVIARLTGQAVAELGLQPGMEATALIKAVTFERN
jgi:molybdate transport system ATP-binding protein